MFMQELCFVRYGNGKGPGKTVRHKIVVTFLWKKLKQRSLILLTWKAWFHEDTTAKPIKMEGTRLHDAL
jgi:hypothetical protein